MDEMKRLRKSKYLDKYGNYLANGTLLNSPMIGRKVVIKNIPLSKINTIIFIFILYEDYHYRKPI